MINLDVRIIVIKMYHSLVDKSRDLEMHFLIITIGY